MKLTDPIDPPNEPCLDVAPAPRFAGPAQFVLPPHEFRMIPALREAAKTQNPVRILASAAEAFYWAAHTSTLPTQQGSVELGNALADLAVTGRVSYGRFKATPLNEATLREVTRARLASSVQAAPGDVANAVSMALDHAYAVAWALRGPIAQRAAARAPLGWIAVSGEDDKPHRPVNVAPPPFEQFEIPVTTHGVTVQTRFFIASAVEDSAPAGILPSTRALPPDPVPLVPDGHQVILFLHGHSSGAEEALAIIPHIHKAGLDHGTKYSIVSFDLPNNGYSQTFDHTTIAPSSATSFPGGIFDHGQIHTPVLDYIEDFVVAFVDALDQITPVKNRFAGVIGGSLGGNLGLRLGRRDLAASPWLYAGIVSWSAASVWDPMVQDEIKRHAPDHCRDMWDVAETDSSRVGYFYEVYDKDVIDVVVPHTQPELWYRDDWQPCKTFHIEGSRIARQEIYNANFRRWHWRVAGEQLIYSHVDRVDHEDKNTPWRFELNKVPQLLVAGQRDNYTGSNIFDATRTLSALMVNTPGRSLFLNDTGHSIHFERPRFFAGEIVNFFSALPTPESPYLDMSYLVPLLLSD
jgi:pimeloyl-ACP methyl ester carboxylesterase